MEKIVITVDGPSGAGKGTLCHVLAEKLGFDFWILGHYIELLL